MTRRSGYFLSLALTLAVTAVCAFLCFKVNVNADMTRYLPDGSPMREGLEVIAEEFDASAMSVADVRVMMKGLGESRAEALKDSLSSFAGVDAVVMQQGSQDHTLYELTVAKTVDQKRLARDIRNRFDFGTVTQTAQDGNTPDPKAIALAVAALLVILLIMSKSWVEPFLFLAATGMAVVINTGTNAFLGSVSITTNSIAAVLQLALSIDYSVILMNRYRQEHDITEALRKSRPAILSSALTTVTGLLMLCFMNLKIGADLGIVLAKGVLCSLVCASAALPGLILLFDRAVAATEKKAPVFPTDGLARFCEKNAVLLTAAFLVIFGGTYYLHNRTAIKFSTNTPSEIDTFFPKKNAAVLVYDNADEAAICALVDSVSADSGVQLALSYPTVMQRPHSAASLTSALKELAEQASMLPGGDTSASAAAAMLSEEIVKVAFYQKFGEPEKLRISTPDLLDFIAGLDPALAGQLSSAESGPGSAGMVSNFLNLPAASMEEPQPMLLHVYMLVLAQQNPSVETQQLVRLTDRDKLSRKMDTKEMSAFMGSTSFQTNMVYSFSKNKSKGMTPLEFAHFLVEDLFNRKSLASMVNDEQRTGMTVRMKIMDIAAAGRRLPKSEIDALVREFGVTPLGDTAFAGEERGVAAPAAADTSAAESAVSGQLLPSNGGAGGKNADTAAEIAGQPAGSAVTPVQAAAPETDPTEAMMDPSRRYTSAQMCRNFEQIGSQVDPSVMSLLYTYYGSHRLYNDEWTMSVEEFVDFLSEDIMNDPRFCAFIGSDIREQFMDMKEQMASGVGRMKGPGHSIAAFITDYPDESPQTEAFLKRLRALCSESLSSEWNLVGESVMFLEMKEGFSKEMRMITLLTVLAILLVVTLTFRSVITAAVLVMTVMSALFFNVTVSGFGGSAVLYLAYLIVQSILMGATIDYGILFTSYYREHGNLSEAYRGSIATILTSGLIMVCVPGAMALLLDDAMIQPIVQSLSLGALSAVVMILFVMPGVISLIYSTKRSRDGREA